MREVLVIGLGSIGERHVRCFQNTGRALVSAVETDPARRQEIASRHSLAKSFGDLDEALKNPPDAAVVATPAPSHVSIATRLVEAGVHVLIEKPLGVGLDGVDGLLSAV
ncbi:MAG: Gfo/Idh/MocA family protein, partial [Isosphaeraceae bacterium]